MTAADDVAQAVHNWRAFYESADAEALQGLWDRSHRTPSYAATESATILRSIPEIEKYYAEMCGILKNLGLSWSLWDLTVDVADGETYAYADCYVDMQSDAVYWQGRANFTFQNRDGAWLLTHYQDSTVYDWMLPRASRFFARQLEAIRTAVAQGEAAEAQRLIDAAATEITVAKLPNIPRSEREAAGEIGPA